MSKDIKKVVIGKRIRKYEAEKLEKSVSLSAETPEMIKKLNEDILTESAKISQPQKVAEAEARMNDLEDLSSIRQKVSIIAENISVVNEDRQARQKVADLQQEKSRLFFNEIAIDDAAKLPNMVPYLTDAEKEALKGKSVKDKTKAIAKAMQEVADGTRETTSVQGLVGKSKSMKAALKAAYPQFKNNNINANTIKPTQRGNLPMIH
ncbi:MAG: hypothetical protein LBM38_00450 [Clostridiales bacterium]|jgi:hypothetical protein|nr:hypothetical protein [Clostridiales bacterium]